MVTVGVQLCSAPTEPLSEGEAEAETASDDDVEAERFRGVTPTAAPPAEGSIIAGLWPRRASGPLTWLRPPKTPYREGPLTAEGIRVSGRLPLYRPKPGVTIVSYKFFASFLSSGARVAP